MELSTGMVSAGCSVFGLVGAAAIGWLNQVDRRQEEKIKDLKAELDSRMAGVAESSKDRERRLAEVERSYISRTDHAEFRAELLSAVRDVGDRVSKSMDGFGAKIEHLVERVTKVEARQGGCK